MTKRACKARPSGVLHVQGFPVRSFGPVGKCIYCGADRYNEQVRKLGKEHIVPLTLDGQLILQQASCEACERITNSFEQPLLKGIFLPIRYEMNLARRKRGQPPPETIPWKTKTGKVVEIPISVYPVFAVFPGFPPCKLLEAATDSPQPAACLLRVADFQERIEKIQIESGEVSWSFEDYFRFLGKIAHSYAVAKFGDHFNPLLIPIIRGESKDYSNYIGGVGFAMPPSENLWELQPTVRLVNGEPHIVIRIRLFGLYGVPPYEVVAGNFTAIQ